ARCSPRVLLRCEFEVAIGDWAVVALQEDRTSWPFARKLRAAGGAGALDVLVNHLPVVEDLYENSIGGLLARPIGIRRSEARGAEGDVKSLPFAGGLAGVHLRRISLVALLAFTSRRFPTLVDGAAIMHAELGLTK